MPPACAPPMVSAESGGGPASGSSGSPWRARQAGSAPASSGPPAAGAGAGGPGGRAGAAARLAARRGRARGRARAVHRRGRGPRPSACMRRTRLFLCYTAVPAGSVRCIAIAPWYVTLARMAHIPSGKASRAGGRKPHVDCFYHVPPSERPKAMLTWPRPLTAARAAAGAAEVLGVDVPCVSAAFGSFAGLVAALEAHLGPCQQSG